ncbi:hypothetical protein ASG31_07505 [Chryseobacterium sp. Leaf404]|uniref:T9SS type A sorting domain-containing protein n=1 Tax=unclassified Chryseobacterium TaxID=2593645 RepID=UPI0006FEA472|nr:MULTISPECIES: T9SS type A sorting domain-containing protein [unclassified Chryseobacterium]KQT18553.1 hypothetical protein ASG31_07505 [Chryseobacterium sp. Leaf404]
MKLKLLFAAIVFTSANANAQLATLNETFESAVVSTPANYNNLVNGWTKKVNAPSPHNIYVDQSNGNKYVNFYSAGSLAADVFLISPQIMAPDGTKQLSFTATRLEGFATMEVGLVDHPESLVANSGVPASYQVLQTYTFTGTNTPVVTPFTVPASSNQYIVFRYRNPQPLFPGSTMSHAVLSIDNVIYDTAGNLSVTEKSKESNEIRFAVNSENTALQFLGKDSPKSVEIYSAGGLKVAAGTVDYNRFSISTLQTGVYYILIETKDGKTQKSKFIKK